MIFLFGAMWDRRRRGREAEGFWFRVVIGALAIMAGVAVGIFGLP